MVSFEKLFYKNMELEFSLETFRKNMSVCHTVILEQFNSHDTVMIKYDKEIRTISIIRSSNKDTKTIYFVKNLIFIYIKVKDLSSLFLTLFVNFVSTINPSTQDIYFNQLVKILNDNEKENSLLEKAAESKRLQINEKTQTDEEVSGGITYCTVHIPTKNSRMRMHIEFEESVSQQECDAYIDTWL